MKLRVLAFCALLALALCDADYGLHGESDVSMKKAIDTESKKITDEAIKKSYVHEFAEAPYGDKTLRNQACQYFIDGMLSKITGGLKRAETRIIETEKAFKNVKKKASDNFYEIFGKILGK